MAKNEPPKPPPDSGPPPPPDLSLGPGTPVRGIPTFSAPALLPSLAASVPLDGPLPSLGNIPPALAPRALAIRNDTQKKEGTQKSGAAKSGTKRKSAAKKR